MTCSKKILANTALRNRTEDALDFLETLPDMILLAEGEAIIHYFVEPEDVTRVGSECLLSGGALLVQLVFERHYEEYRSELVCSEPGREELLLHVTAAAAPQ